MSNETNCSPLNDFPKTKQTVDADGKPVYTIEPLFETPWRARIANALSILSTAAACEAVVIWLFPLVNPEFWAFFACSAGLFLLYGLFWAMFQVLFLKKIRIDLSSTELRIRRRFRWRKYDRQITHSFALLPHDRTKAEAKRHEFLTKEAQKDGEVVQFTEWYGDSVHLCLIHAGQRIDIATIYGRKTALAILARLKLCDAILDSASGINGGLSLSPDQESSSQPGDLPLE